MAFKRLIIAATAIAGTSSIGFSMMKDKNQTNDTKTNTLGFLPFLAKTQSSLSPNLLGLSSTLLHAESAPQKGNRKTRVVVVGGGTAGVTVASQLLRQASETIDVTIIEPHDEHYYQPGWTLVGSGVLDREETVRPMKDILPEKANWLQQSVATFSPDQNFVTTAEGQKLEYDYLVVAPGIVLNWEGVKGLSETIGKNGVVSIYAFDQCQAVWKEIKNFKKGTAIFTQPKGAIKCGGAPQKIMWMAEDHFRRTKIRKDVCVKFATPLSVMFPVARYGGTLEQLRQKRDVDGLFQHALVEVRGPEKEAVFEKADGSLVVEKFDLLHVVPPMQAPAFIRNSPLADATGYVEVDKETLRHTRFSNIFGLGDASNLPTSKTAAAISSQAPVVVSNLKSSIAGKPLIAKYDGYTSCPLLTGKNELILAEFKYGLVPSETFSSIFDQSKPSALFYHMKVEFFPRVYWHCFVKGIWYGPAGFLKPFD
eukprot:CAMPEP_0184347102 /NCGR_PEP_ID=MMETSP1089-20130417/15254_1 /TAXON_ID=38269 ORGANISM="Gloeochaete wittrockiana, Strain SAG46.84" /NCGR_SAMPLE_ID=MMETSP1089 /ASSEMBLY_ACC=CAM_ASM_000445 /LENGTH=479 /DNA_ID=CAMNT_0026678031 /DNA_START=15 /DNA_END=1454 /DNA_ORIENTATION=-